MLQSAVVTSMLSIHRLIGTYQHNISVHIALSKFTKEIFVSAGVNRDRIYLNLTSLISTTLNLKREKMDFSSDDFLQKKD